MSQIFFKKRFQDAIRAGSKSTTIRRWNRAIVQPGGRSFSPGLGWLAIDAVQAIRLEDLGDGDAVADGFATVDEMTQVLLEMYPAHATDGKQWYRVRFRVESLLVRNKAVKQDEPTLW